MFEELESVLARCLDSNYERTVRVLHNALVMAAQLDANVGGDVSPQLKLIGPIEKWLKIYE